MENITAVILAAGEGTRMKTKLPKVLHKVGSMTMLGKVISNLKEAGVADIVVVVGYKAEQVEELFKGQVRFVRQTELLGSGDALIRAMGSLGETSGKVLVTCGDAPLIPSETYRKMTREKEGVSCVVLTCEVPDPSAYGRIVRDAGGNVRNIAEEKDATREEKEIREINVGTYCFLRGDLERFLKEIKMNEKKREFYLTDIIGILTANGKKVASESCGIEEMIGINSRKDLALASGIVNRKKLEELMVSGVTIVDPDTTRVDETASVGRDTVVFPFTVIEGDVMVGEGCKIGPFAHLRSGTTLADDVEIGNFVEVCRTEIGSGTRVKHHAYLGDAVIGKCVNIGAGAVTANYDGRKKNSTVIGDNASIGAGAVLVAPVKVGRGATVGAGSVVTKMKDVADGETVVGIPARSIYKSDT
ncbi:MAG: NTP transferase domain-containing protein [Candidatus Omnitrophota bacterium]